MSDQEQSPPVDLLEHLRRQYLNQAELRAENLEEVSEEIAHTPQLTNVATEAIKIAIDGFVEFCRKRLNEDRPVTVTMIEDGIALRLQSGLELPIAEVKREVNQAGAVAVTTPTQDRYHEYGGPAMQNTSAPIEITDGKNLGKGLPGKKQA